MKQAHKKFLLGILLASVGLAATAQSNPPAAPAAPARESGDLRRPMNPGDQENMKQRRMDERHARSREALKTRLQLRPDQESAWTTYSTAMRPPASQARRMDTRELAKLSTPERVDQINSRLAQHQETMRQRGEASKAFYAVLSAEQKKIFDKETFPRERRGPERQR